MTRSPKIVESKRFADTRAKSQEQSPWLHRGLIDDESILVPTVGPNANPTEPTRPIRNAGRLSLELIIR